MLRLIIDLFKDRVYSFFRRAISFRALKKEREMKRLKELVHYICDECKDEPGFGITKLYKILWYLDTFAFLKCGKPVSGNTVYVKRQYGPAPKHILGVLKRLEIEESVLTQKHEYCNRIKTEFIVLKPARKESFTTEEKEMIEDISQAVCRRTAKEISDLSHNAIWKAAKMGEKIPLHMVLAVPDKISKRDEARFLDFLLSRHS